MTCFFTVYTTDSTVRHKSKIWGESTSPESQLKIAAMQGFMELRSDEFVPWHQIRKLALNVIDGQSGDGASGSDSDT